MAHVEEIPLKARYGLTHRLVPLTGNKYQLMFDEKSTGFFCINHDKDGTILTIDPEGGPCIGLGDEVGGKRVKSIGEHGIIELEDF